VTTLHALERSLSESILGRRAHETFLTSRQSVYRRLVRANLDDVIASLLPRTAARGGARFWEEVAAFYDERGPRTHYLRDVPSELVSWASSRWPDDESLPAYLHDLARHEIAAMEIGAMAGDEAREAKGELSLEGAVVMAEATQLRRYRFAVHALPLDEDDRTVPDAREVALLIYRDREHSLRYLELTPAAAAILERLLAGTAVGAAITEGATSVGLAVDAALLEGTAALLGDLAERGVLLGSA
jgi:hypothetical protein